MPDDRAEPDPDETEGRRLRAAAPPGGSARASASKVLARCPMAHVDGCPITEVSRAIEQAEAAARAQAEQALTNLLIDPGTDAKDHAGLGLAIIAIRALAANPQGQGGQGDGG